MGQEKKEGEGLGQKGQGAQRAAGRRAHRASGEPLIQENGQVGQEQGRDHEIGSDHREGHVKADRNAGEEQH